MTSIDNSPTFQTTRCIECRLDIPDDARVCTHCDAHQEKWRNRLKSLSTTAGTATVIGAALTYMASTAPEIRKAIAWNDKVEVLQFTTRKGLSLMNVGDGMVHISHLALDATHPNGKHLFTRTIQIDKEVDKEKFLFVAGDDDRLKGRRLIIRENTDDIGLSYALTDAGDTEAVVAGHKCHLWVVYKQDSALLQMYKNNLGTNLRTYPVHVDLFYYSVKRREMRSISIEAVGLLQRSIEGTCAPITSNRAGQ